MPGRTHFVFAGRTTSESALGLQIRQNTQSQRVVAVDSLAAAIAAINVPAMQSPVLGEALSKALQDWGSASREQRIVAHYFLFSYFKLGESAWYQQKSRVLDPTQWVGWETMLRAFYQSAGVKSVWWPRRRHAYSHEFQSYLAASPSPPAEIGSLNDLFDNVPASKGALDLSRS